jgi:hypothetical protein
MKIERAAPFAAPPSKTLETMNANQLLDAVTSTMPKTVGTPGRAAGPAAIIGVTLVFISSSTS